MRLAFDNTIPGPGMLKVWNFDAEIDLIKLLHIASLN